VSTPTIDRPLKPVADVFMFIEDKKADYKKKYPTMDDNELRRFMVKEFNCISDRDKVRLVVLFQYKVVYSYLCMYVCMYVRIFISGAP